MHFDDALKKISEPADLAIFFVSFSIGFVLAALFFDGGIPHSTVAGVFAVGFLGLKKAIDASLSRPEYTSERAVKKRARMLQQHFDSKKNREAGNLIERLFQLLDAKIIDYEQFTTLIDEKLQKYVDKELEQVGSLPGDYDSVYHDLERLYLLSIEPDKYKTEVEPFLKKLDTTYGFTEKSRKAQIAMKRNWPVPTDFMQL